MPHSLHAFRVAIGLLGLALPFASVAASAQKPAPDVVDAHGRHFAARSGSAMTVAGSTFRQAGSNNYYLMYSSHFMVDNVLTTAAAQNFNTMRTWGFIDIGNQDGSNSIDGPHNGVYFHYFNGTAPAFNDGPTGLQNLDYVVYKAGQLNLKLVIPFVNNYDQFGGMDQYIRWRGLQFHDQFYTDPTIRTWYKQWIAHVLNHVNVYTGIKYKDDATILTWELANEERCTGFGAYPGSGKCTTQTITDWARDVSGYIKRVDPKHLVSSGSEGFYCDDPSSNDFTVNCSQGVDSIALAKLPAMDIISYHLYPDDWGKTPEWGTQWIARHIADSHTLGDRAVAGEWGIREKNIRNPVYKQWDDTVQADATAGALYWILSGLEDNGTLYPDYDGYTVYCPSPVCSVFTNFARSVQGLPVNQSPIADNDTATTPNLKPVTLNVTANDVTYNGATLNLQTVDLDPSTPGRQVAHRTADGLYTLNSGGNVNFQPASTCTIGAVSTPYIVADSQGRTSNPANITITVGGIPGQLFNFEDGIDTWGAASYNANAGTVAQATGTGATSCTHSLEVTATAGGFFGPTYNSGPLPLKTAGITNLLFDITTGSQGTSQSVAVQFGSDYHYCSTPFTNQNAGTTATYTVNLKDLATAANCFGSAPADTSLIQGFFVYFSGGGSYYLDNIRTQ